MHITVHELITDYITLARRPIHLADTFVHNEFVSSAKCDEL